MADFRYIFGSMRAEQVIEEIPLYGVVMNMEMNAGGYFEGTFQLDQLGKDNATLLQATIPGRTWVTCERNGVAIWHGYVWTRTYSSQSKTCQLFAQSFEQYPEKRRILQDLTYNGEQLNIFIDLWSKMMAANGSDINVIIPALGSYPTVVTKSLATLQTDNRLFSEVMSAVADSVNGFDWYIDVVKNGTYYQKNLLLGYPTLGAPAGPNTVVFEYPGNILEYYFTEAMADAGTDIYVVGAGTGSNQILGFAEDTNLINTGMVRWDDIVSRTDVTDSTTAQSLANQELVKRRAPMPTLKIWVKSNLTPEFGSYNLGDVCSIYIKDPRFPNGLSLQKRLIKWELTPQSADNSEQASLVFEGDTT